MEAVTTTSQSQNTLSTSSVTPANPETVKFETKAAGDDFEQMLKALLPATQENNVSEEELFAALVRERVFSLKGEDAAQKFDAAFAGKKAQFTKADGFIAYEAAAVETIKELARTGVLSSSEGDQVYSESFAGAQLDSNAATLWDRRGGKNDPTIENNVSKMVKSLFTKDACVAKRKSKYLAAVEFDLTGVDPAEYTPGVTLAITLNRSVRKGDMSASIKPVSDGIYAPRPIVLMASLGGYGNENIRLLRWKRGKITSTRLIKVGKYTYHFGHYYAVGVLNTKYLTGGNGVFEISNGYEAYSVCFKLERRRQKVNGYP